MTASHKSSIIPAFCSVFLLITFNCLCEGIPVIHAKSAITIDVETREIIFAKNIDTIRYPASTSKLVTAILLAQNSKRSDILYYSVNAKNEYPYILDLRAGDSMSADSAMDALLLFSGNDIAHMIAENISGTIENFAALMNSYARTLGLSNTHFINPSGLHDPKQITTAYELSVIAREMYEYPWIMESSIKEFSLISTESGYRTEIKNRNKLVGKNGCIAGKTGWTPEAGRCLVALYERSGRKIAGVVMDSLYLPDDIAAFDDMEAIMDFSYSSNKKQIIPSGRWGKSVLVTFKTLWITGIEVEIEVPLRTKKSIDCYFSGTPLIPYTHMEKIDPWNLNKDRQIGEFQLVEKEVAHSVLLFPEFATIDIIGMNIWIYFFYGFILFIILLSVFTVLYLKKRKSPDIKSRNSLGNDCQ